MAKKNNRPRPPQSPKPAPAPAPAAAPADGVTLKRMVDEMVRYPTLFMASVFLAISIIAIWAAIRYRNDLNMGVLAEPTNIILWVGLAVTLFASYWRRRSRDQKPVA